VTQVDHHQEGDYTVVISQTGRRFRLVCADVVESLDEDPRGDHEPRWDNYGSFPVSTPEGHAFIIHSEQLGGGRPENRGVDKNGQWYRLLGKGRAERISRVSHKIPANRLRPGADVLLTDA
jgi:hypothetical protein